MILTVMTNVNDTNQCKLRSAKNRCSINKLINTWSYDTCDEEHILAFLV